MGSGTNWADHVSMLRRRLSLTQTQMADLVGVRYRETISNWERGIDTPDINRQVMLRRLLEELDSKDELESLRDMVATTGGLATLLDSELRILGTSPMHQTLSTYDVTELYGQPSERHWSPEMGRIMAVIGGLKGYRERGIRRLDLKLEMQRQPGDPGYNANVRQFTVGSTISWGPVHKPYAFLTQLRIETGGEPSPPLIKLASGSLEPLRT